MEVFGLIGGIGSGKSTVAKMFEDLGAVVVDADKVGHSVLLDPEVKNVVAARWGNGVFAGDGEIDRRKLADVVFDDSEQGRNDLEYLKFLTHPLIGKYVVARFHDLDKSGTKIIVFDAPLLLEAGWDSLVRKLIFVDAPQPVRLARVLTRGWSKTEFKTREAAQISVEQKRAKADWIVNNSGNFAETLDQVVDIWQNFIIPPM